MFYLEYLLLPILFGLPIYYLNRLHALTYAQRDCWLQVANARR